MNRFVIASPTQSGAAIQPLDRLGALSSSNGLESRWITKKPALRLGEGVALLLAMTEGK